jgi:flavorubredoxin
MFTHKLSERVWQLPSVDWNRRLFDALIPLPDGTSYNAYFVQGSEKNVLLDTSEPILGEDFLKALEKLPAPDYVVSQHAEQDHSGALPAVLAKYPEAQLIATPKAKPMLMDLLHLPADRIITAEDGAELALGDRTLEFIHVPWVHWPETMSTYLREERILFSCDFFGSHLATSELFHNDEGRALEAAKRYYAEIMMPFARIIRKNLERLEPYEMAVIAPSHGPAYSRPALILDAYRDWVFGEAKNEVVLPYVSMHDSTRIMAEYLTKALVERGIAVHLFDLAVTDLGKLAIALVDAATLVLGSCTVLAGPHPAAAYGALLINALRPLKVQNFAVIGSFLWGGKTVETLSGLLSNLKVETLEPVYIKGLPRPGDFECLDHLAEQIAQKHRSAGLLKTGA